MDGLEYIDSPIGPGVGLVLAILIAFVIKLDADRLRDRGAKLSAVAVGLDIFYLLNIRCSCSSLFGSSRYRLAEVNCINLGRN